MNKPSSITLFTLICMLMLYISACTQDQSFQCQTSADCFSEEICHQQRCVLRATTQTTTSTQDNPDSPNESPYPLPPEPTQNTDQHHNEDMSPSSDDQGSDNQRPWPDQDHMYATTQDPSTLAADMGPDLTEESDSSQDTPDPCIDAVPPTPGELVINEILMNVPTGDEGDANADGTRDAYDDEFIELVNTSELTLDMSLISLLVNENIKHLFSNVCIPPGHGIVIFSGPRDRIAVWRSEVLFMAPDTKLGLNNSSGKVELWDRHDRVLFSLSYEDAQKTSYVLWPELTGTTFVPHNTISEDLFSPGRCSNTLALSTGCITDE